MNSLKSIESVNCKFQKLRDRFGSDPNFRGSKLQEDDPPLYDPIEISNASVTKTSLQTPKLVKELTEATGSRLGTR